MVETQTIATARRGGGSSPLSQSTSTLPDSGAGRDGDDEAPGRKWRQTMASDLDAAIRRDLDYRRTQLVDPDNATAEIAFEGMRDAILAVLHEHRRIPSDIAVGAFVCSCMPDSDDHYVAHADPCPTKQAIAKALEVEASND